MQDAFVDLIERSVQRNLAVGELLQAAEALRPSGSVHALYSTWITHNADHPLSYAVMFNYAVVLTEMGALDAARIYLERAVALNPDFMPAYINLGRVYESIGNQHQAVEQWLKALNRLAPVTGTSVRHKVIALTQAARVLEAVHQDPEAEDLLRQILELDRTHREALQHLIAVRQRQCKWPVLPTIEGMSRSELTAGMSPLSAAACTDDPLFQLAVAWNYSRTEIGVPGSRIHTSHPGAARSGKLRIGYLSSDLREHAVGYLMAEVFELHDREKVEVFAYYCGPAAESGLQDRFKASTDHWVSISSMDDATAAQRMIDDGIQILVDVNGYTREARLKLLALRPAPVIVNWLGFPGSAASPFHHYLIADEWIVPPSHEVYYSERVMRVPCYQPNDRQRLVSDRRFERQAMGLPATGIVFCSFNGTHKITQATFDRWLAILSGVPGSVLWLMAGDEPTNDRLRHHAERHGIARERLVCADKLPHAEHLARYRLADLFLDSSPYGAHTTASDALWMGVPVLTFSGRCFASRVCGSLVRSAGIPELVCRDGEEFTERAISLGRNPEELAVYRERLLEGRDGSVLFDTPGLMRHLEDKYDEMWNSYLEGQLPVPDLTNLDVYLEIGSRFDRDEVEPELNRGYEAFWRRHLKQRDAYLPVPKDSRLP